MIAEHLDQGHYGASGTVLLRKDSSKGGRSLLLFLRGFGARWVGAPSSGEKNRFGGGAEPMIWGTFSLYQSVNRLYVQSIDVKEDFIALRKSPAVLACAARLYKLTADETPNCCENDALLRALWGAMIQLRDGALPLAVEFRYMWKFLAAAGSAPSLEYCAGCGRRLTNGAYFTGEGLLCAGCATDGGGRVISQTELLSLRAAAALSHDKFIEWAAKKADKEIFALNIKNMSSYFRNLR